MPVSEDPIVSALGCTVRIDVSDLSSADVAEIRRVWGDAAPLAGDPAPAAELVVQAYDELSTARMLSLLSQQVTFAAIQARKGELWMLHAAGLADPQGRVVALIGPSGTGKTTAAKTLATRYGYVSDETSGISIDGDVLPYRKPLSVIEDGQKIKVQRSPSELGLRPLPDRPLRLAAIVLLDRRTDGPDQAVLEDCDLAEALPDLVAQTSYISSVDSALQTIAAHAEAVGGVRRVVYREASSLADAIEPLFRDPQPVRAPAPATPVGPAPESPGIHRGPYLDVLTFEQQNRLALLQQSDATNTMFRMVGGIGPELWRAAAQPSSVDQLAAAAVAAYGAPDGTDALAVTREAIDELIAQEVLVEIPERS